MNWDDCSNLQLSILEHTSSNGRYVVGPDSPTHFAAITALAEAGLLFDHGAQRLAGGAHYYTTTMRGRVALAEYRATLPKPKRPTAAQQRYRDFLNADCGLKFIEWLRGRSKQQAR